MMPRRCYDTLRQAPICCAFLFATITPPGLCRRPSLRRCRAITTLMRFLLIAIEMPRCAPSCRADYRFDAAADDAGTLIIFAYAAAPRRFRDTPTEDAAAAAFRHVCRAMSRLMPPLMYGSRCHAPPDAAAVLAPPALVAAGYELMPLMILPRGVAPIRAAATASYHFARDGLA